MAGSERERVTDELVKQLPPDLALLFTAFRQEFDAKIASIKAWGVAALLGGGTLGGLVGAFLPQAAPVRDAVVAALPFL